jgi:hypothetical protein
LRGGLRHSADNAGTRLSFHLLGRSHKPSLRKLRACPIPACASPH